MISVITLPLLLMVAPIHFPSTTSTSIIDYIGLDFCIRKGNRYFPNIHEHYH